MVLKAQPIISDSLLKSHISALAHDSMMGRFTGRHEINLAANYIAGQMHSIGLKKMAGFNGFFVPWNMKMYKENPGQHVVGLIPGIKKREELIIFSAHYDHVGPLSSQKAFPFGSVNKKTKGDTIFNGANDDASGVAALLELARAYAAIQPEYTLLFVAFSGEELGLLGSADFNENLNPTKVKMNVNLEMLGRPNSSRPFIIEEGDQHSFRVLLNKNLANAGLGYPKSYFISDPYPEQGLFKRSDNYSFHKNGIPSFTIMATSPLDTFYHSTADELSSIQFQQMGKIVNAIYNALLPIVLDE